MESGLGVELGDLVGSLLHVGGTDAEPLGDLAPAMVDQLLEAVTYEPERNRLLKTSFLELEKEAFAKVARANARGVEGLDCPQHSVPFLDRVQGQVV